MKLLFMILSQVVKGKAGRSLLISVTYQTQYDSSMWTPVRLADITVPPLMLRCSLPLRKCALILAIANIRRKRPSINSIIRLHRHHEEVMNKFAGIILSGPKPNNVIEISVHRLSWAISGLNNFLVELFCLLICVPARVKRNTRVVIFENFVKLRLFK